MTCLRNKLNSRRGASILLALLFLLFCMMVASSILAAAVSNAGKIRSSREEQQKYLTLSSALRLVCEELAGAAYCGQYGYVKEEVYRPEPGADGTETEVLDHYRYTYTQLEGKFTCGLNSAASPDILPLVHDLDLLFMKNFVLPEAEKKPGDEYEFQTLSEPQMVPRGPHILTLTANAGGDAGPGFSETVTVSVEIRPAGVIRLTAALGEKDEDGYLYTMEAELRPNASPGKLFVLGGSPSEGSVNQTGVMTWTMGWIAKKEAAGG